MADKEYVSLSVEPDAREDLRWMGLRIGTELRRKVTSSEVLIIATEVIAQVLHSGDAAGLIKKADEKMRAEKSGGCE